jgi:hypothetical protein
MGKGVKPVGKNRKKSLLPSNFADASVTGAGQVDSKVAGLIFGPNVKLPFDLQAGSASERVITYSFVDNDQRAANYRIESLPRSIDSAITKYYALTDSRLQDIVRNAFKEVESLIDLDFVEINETDAPQSTSADRGQIRIILADFPDTDTSVAGALEPSSSNSGDRLSGRSDIIFRRNYVEDALKNQDSAWLASTFTHELGHALGLKHPGVYSSDSGESPPPHLSIQEDNMNKTIMSYNKFRGGVRGFMPYDLLALWSLYGGRPSYPAGDFTALNTPAGSMVLPYAGGGSSDTFFYGKSKEEKQNTVYINLQSSYRSLPFVYNPSTIAEINLEQAPKLSQRVVVDGWWLMPGNRFERITLGNHNENITLETGADAAKEVFLLPAYHDDHQISSNDTIIGSMSEDVIDLTAHFSDDISRSNDGVSELITIKQLGGQQQSTIRLMGSSPGKAATVLTGPTRVYTPIDENGDIRLSRDQKGFIHVSYAFIPGKHYIVLDDRKKSAVDNRFIQPDLGERIISADYIAPEGSSLATALLVQDTVFTNSYELHLLHDSQGYNIVYDRADTTQRQLKDKTALFYQCEVVFKHDMNKDGILGKPANTDPQVTVIDSMGGTHAYYDKSGIVYVQAQDQITGQNIGAPVPLRESNGNEDIYGDSIWGFIGAAEKLDGTNKAVFLKDMGFGERRLTVFEYDSNWRLNELSSNVDSIYFNTGNQSLIDSKVFAYERLFGKDFTGDSLIGASPA